MLVHVVVLLVVSFSGIEHDGLGRYGDPLLADGDRMAMLEMHRCLAPRGLLLLAVPTNEKDAVDWPNHRFYGPMRLPWLLQNFTLLARVSTGRILRGWERKQALYTTGYHWNHQPVLVLQKEPTEGDAAAPAVEMGSWAALWP